MQLYRRDLDILDPNYGLFWYTYIDYKTIVHLFHGYFSRRLIMDTRQFVPEQDSIKYILVLSQGSLILFSTYMRKFALH